MIERHNIAIKFLKKQGRQLYRIPKETNFAFAYHPYRSSVAPEIGYIIKDDKTLKKIFLIGNSKTTKELPTIILHIVFEDQFHLYENDGTPFGGNRRESTKTRESNSDIGFANGELSPTHTYEKTKTMHETQYPSSIIHLNRTAEHVSTIDEDTMSKSAHRPDPKTKTFYNPKKQSVGDIAKRLETQKFVFIKVKDRHQYDLNPKLIKFFLAELLKDAKNRARLAMMNRKLSSVIKDKVLKFGMQQYFNVMDEIVNMLEGVLQEEEETTTSKFKRSTIGKESEEIKRNNNDLILPDTRKSIFREDKSTKSITTHQYRTKENFNQSREVN